MNIRLLHYTSFGYSPLQYGPYAFAEFCTANAIEAAIVKSPLISSNHQTDNPLSSKDLDKLDVRFSTGGRFFLVGMYIDIFMDKLFI